jgi:pyrophosphatase PpaX
MTEPSAPVTTVLYDFDGTLADSTELIMHCYRHTMTEHLGAAPPDEEWLAGFGTPLEGQIRRFARSPAEYDSMLAMYREVQGGHHDAMLRPFPGAVGTVVALAVRGVRLAIVTSRHREGTLRGMELCGLLDHFPVIVTPEDVAHAKPHPEPVLRALELLGAPASETVFVGDSPHDMEAGRAAGVRVAAVLWGPFPPERLRAERPDWLLRAHGDVLELVGAAAAAG